MTFKTKMRGYSKKEVDKYLADLEQRENNLRAAQKQRIDELSDENFALRRQIEAYTSSERAIVQSLVDANHLAEEVQGSAQKFAEVTLERAKSFYVAWSTYAKTLIATLSDEEVKRFNELKEKVERTIDAYEGSGVAAYAAEVTAKMESDAQAANAQNPSAQEAQQNSETSKAALQNDDASPTQQEVDAQLRPLTAAAEAPSNAQKRAIERLTNPIDKVQKASGQAIDLRELVRPTESLADLCRDLGLDVDESAE